MADFTGGSQDHSIRARDVRPGMVVWNPYGGARGRAVAASEPRQRPDGTVEFDTADGRTGVFRPHFRLHLDRAATQRLAAERDAERPLPPRTPPQTAGPGINTHPGRPAAETSPGREKTGAASDGADAQTVTTAGPASSLREPRTGKAAAWATQATLNAIHSGQLRAELLEDCEFWAAKAAQQRIQADARAAGYDLDREA